MTIKILSKTAKHGFKLLAGINRSIIPAQVTKLAKSLDTMGCIRPVVVSKITFLPEGPGLYIIDGQHLFHALLRNGMDIPYIEIVIKDKTDLIEKIALLNASSKNWSMSDYITAWCSISNEYVKLKKYYDTYDFDLSFLASLFMGIPSNGGSVSKWIKSGKFQFKISEIEILKKLDYLTDVLKVIPRMNRLENRYVCNEYLEFLSSQGSSYDHKRFLNNLTKNKKSLILVTAEPHKLSEIFNNIAK